VTSANRWTLVATILASSLTFIDANVVNVALPALQSDLHATITDVQWVIESYALFFGALILVGGSMGDQFGRKRMFLFGVAFFAVASVMCGLATSARVLIVGRALQGVGAAFLAPGSLAIISATFDDTERGAAIGTWSGFSAITTAAGPVIGGWMIDHISWRAVFYMNVPLAIMVVLLSLKYMDETKDDSRTAATDWTGAALSVIGLGGIVFGLLEWTPLGAGHPLVVGSLILGVLSIPCLLLVEHSAANAMMPLHLFESRSFLFSNILTLLLYAALGVIFFLVPLDLIQVQRYSATKAGAALLPFPVIMFVLGRWSGGLVARVGSRLPLTVGPLIASLGMGLYARPSIGGSYWTTFFPAVSILGIGMAITVAPLTTTVMDAVDRSHAGVASGINNAVARVAGLLAIAVFGVVMARSFATNVAPRLDRIGLTPEVRAATDRQLVKMTGAELDSVAALQPAQQAAVRESIDGSFVSTFRLLMLMAGALALLSVGAGLAIETPRRRSTP
jgi:EmrB/QacA subfamily drug resistance transporter